ncbi:hypothetical protein T492DRAFT_958979 [Pavlovales sp. CCMP2436]|nr:hypothetical protein T492DRAFT_958979 [Pavlovales sp. CCMP2436]
MRLFHLPRRLSATNLTRGILKKLLCFLIDQIKYSRRIKNLARERPAPVGRCPAERPLPLRVS